MTMQPPSLHGLEPLRIAAGALSVGLLLRGASIYRLAVVAPGVLAGILGGLTLAREFGLASDATLGFAVGGGVAGALLAWLVERVAVMTAGVLVGVAVANLLVPLVVAHPPWWTVPAGGAAGALLGPTLYRAALPLVTSLVGAFGLVWAAGWAPTPVVLGGLFAAGVVVQFATGGTKRSEATADER